MLSSSRARRRATASSWPGGSRQRAVSKGLNSTEGERETAHVPGSQSSQMFLGVEKEEADMV